MLCTSGFVDDVIIAQNGGVTEASINNVEASDVMLLCAG